MPAKNFAFNFPGSTPNSLRLVSQPMKQTVPNNWAFFAELNCFAHVQSVALLVAGLVHPLASLPIMASDGLAGDFRVIVADPSAGAAHPGWWALFRQLLCSLSTYILYIS